MEPRLRIDSNVRPISTTQTDTRPGDPASGISRPSPWHAIARRSHGAQLPIPLDWAESPGRVSLEVSIRECGSAPVKRVRAKGNDELDANEVIGRGDTKRVSALPMPLRMEAGAVGVDELSRTVRLCANGVEANPPGWMAVVPLRDSGTEEHRVGRTVTARLVEDNSRGVACSWRIRPRVGALGLLTCTRRRAERDAQRDKRKLDTKT